MAYLNKVFLIGNLTRDPELKVIPNGTSHCSFGIAVTKRYKSESGEDREETAFVDIEAWGKQGEICAKYLTKGSPAMVEGRLKFDQWEDKTSGQKRSKLKLVLENVQFLGQRPANDGGGQNQDQHEHHQNQAPPQRNAPPQQNQQRQQNRTPPPPSNIDEDVPF